MSEGRETLRDVLDGFDAFLKERDLAPPKQRPHLV